MIKGNFNISTGGRVMSVSNDRGTTKEVVYQPKSEPAYKVADRERTQRAAAYFGNPREAAIERELMKQVTSKPEPKFNTDLINIEREVWRQKLMGDRTRQLSAELFNQVANVR